MTAPKKNLKDVKGPVLPKKDVMDEASEKHVYPQQHKGQYNVKVYDDGFYDAAVDKHGGEIEYVPLPRDLPPSVRKRMDEERKKKKKGK